MKHFYYLILVLSTISFTKYSKADHLLGIDMTYKSSSKNDSIFYITAILYRDCTGCYILGQSPKCGTTENCNSSSTVPTSLTLSCLTSSYSTKISMTRTSITDVTDLCKTDTSKCAQPCTGKYPYGIEKHVFEGTLDLRSAMKTGCCSFNLSTFLYTRSPYLTTIQPQNSLYTFLELNVCDSKSNSSPTFSNNPRVVMCCNQPFFYNMGAFDVENDSLSYSFSTAYMSKGSSSYYNSPFSYSYPMTAYFPTGKNPPYSDPKANPPIGIFLDPKNGDLVLTPTNCSQIAVLVLQVDEWRKDSKGKYKNISNTRRDITVFINNCNNDNPPNITNKTNSYSVCEGDQLCFDITTEDKPYGSAKPDTVALSWNESISDASFTIKNKKDREQTGTFCWTPKIENSKTNSFYFTAKAKSNNCPLPAISIRAFEIKVTSTTKTKVAISELGCNKFKIQSSPLSGIISPVKFNWQIIDSLGKPVNDTVANFSSGKNFSTKEIDTLTLKLEGKFFLKHTISDANNCPTIYIDTLKSYISLNVKNALGKDTSICPFTSITIKSSVNKGVPYYKYQWFTPNKNNKDTLPTFNLITSTKDTLISVEIKDANGCVGLDSIKILSFPLPTLDLGNDIKICQTDSAILDAGNFSSYKWNNGNNSKTITVKKAGNYSVVVTNTFECIKSDSINVSILSSPNVDLGKDTSTCENDSLILDAGNFSSYKWNNGKTSKSIFVSSSGTYSVIVKDINGCIGSDNINLNFLPIPNVDLGNDTSFCKGDSIRLDGGNFNSYKWNTGKDTRYIWEKAKGTYKVTVADTNGCKNSDSIFINNFSLPNINLGKDTVICNGDSIILNAGIFINIKWSTGENTKSIVVKNQDSYFLEVKDSNGCKNSDTINISLKNCSGNIKLSDKLKVNLYPNPATDILTIEFINSSDIATIELSDLNGKLVFRKELTSKGLIIEQIKLKSINRGYYLINISSSAGNYSGKILLK